MSNGIPLGLIHHKVGYLEGIKALFDFRLPHGVACRRFLRSRQRRQPPAMVWLKDAVMTACFAPTGAGKGVSLVIPWLLHNDESALVIDPKGENYEITADYRREQMGHQIVRLDPFGLMGPGGDGYNVLDFIDPRSDLALDDLRALAEAIVIKTKGSDKDPFWNSMSEIFITAMTAAVLTFLEGRRDLQAVRTLLGDAELRNQAIQMMCASDIWGGLLARCGNSVKSVQDKMLDSILACVSTHMGFLDTVPVARATTKSTWDPRSLLTGKTTVYLILPPEYQRSQAGLQRLIVGSLLRTVIKGGLSKRQVHFLLDEAASLGHMECIDDVLAIGRGYGIRCHFFYQSMAQLQTTFPEGQDQTFLANVSQIFFGVQDQATAEYVSNRLGEFTQVVHSGGRSYGGSSSTSSSGQGNSSSQGSNWNTNSNWQQAARKLLQPSEVIGLDRDIAITLHPGVPPIMSRLCPYFNGPPPTGKMHPLRMAAKTISWLLCALIFALFVTAFFLSPTLEVIRERQQTTPRPTQGRGGPAEIDGAGGCRDGGHQGKPRRLP
jgi:type IV secretion system protein VirD4